MPAGRSATAWPASTRASHSGIGVITTDPQLVAQVPRVARAADVHLQGADPQAPPSVVGQVRQRAPASRPPARGATGAPGWPEPPGRRSRSSTLHVQAARVEAQPAQLSLGRGPAPRAVVQAVERAVVDEPTVLVAPGRVDDPPGRRARAASRVMTRSTSRVGVPPREVVLAERRDVDERRRVADGVDLDVDAAGRRRWARMRPDHTRHWRRTLSGPCPRLEGRAEVDAHGSPHATARPAVVNEPPRRRDGRLQAATVGSVPHATTPSSSVAATTASSAPPTSPGAGCGRSSSSVATCSAARR